MNARASENYLAISSKSVEIYWGRLFFRAESSLIQSRLTIACLNLLDIAEVRARGHNSSVYIQSSCRSFIRVIVPCEISKVNFRVETKILVSVRRDLIN